jgi:hypothetical protein
MDPDPVTTAIQTCQTLWLDSAALSLSQLISSDQINGELICLLSLNLTKLYRSWVWIYQKGWGGGRISMQQDSAFEENKTCAHAHTQSVRERVNAFRVNVWLIFHLCMHFQHVICVTTLPSEWCCCWLICMFLNTSVWNAARQTSKQRRWLKTQYVPPCNSRRSGQYWGNPMSHSFEY